MPTKNKSVPGIQFITDTSGNPTAVQIDLKRYARLWEDIYDGIIGEQRKSEPTVSWDEVKQRLRAKRAKK